MNTTQLALFDVPSPIRHTTGFCYWATDGKDVKGGYTISPTRRGGELKLTMLHTAPGNIEDEQATHRRWIKHRIPGTEEWYYPHRELLRHLEGIVVPGTAAWAALRLLIWRQIRPD